MFKKLFAAFGAVVVLGAVYLLAWPVPIAPVAWQAPLGPGHQGGHAPNQRLADMNLIDLREEVGPEHIVIGKDGLLYTTVASGNILRMNPDGSDPQAFFNTGGRVLGFDFDAAGHLIAAAAVKRFLSVAPGGQVQVLADHVGDDPIRYADAVVVAKNGKIYLSDASTRFAPKDWGGTFEASVLDILEQSATGRVLEYDPAIRAVRVVAKGLSFANGVALSSDEQHLDIAQGGAQAQVLLDNLPGYPDNLMRGLDGKIWLGFAKPRNPTIDGMAGKPWLRALTLRLPRALWPIPKAYGHVIAFTEDGKVVADLQDPTGAYPETTAITETPERLYVQSLHAKGLGWMRKGTPP